MENGTFFDHFVIKGFPGHPVLNKLMFTVLLLIYLLTLAGNLLIIFTICRDYRLHSPMYFFLVCLSIMELIGISGVLPKLLVILIAEHLYISRVSCFLQTFLYYFVTSYDFLILTVMSIDRYMAICFPLRYFTLMRSNICITLVIGCLAVPFLLTFYPVVILSRLPFCNNVVNHFFCESAAMLKLVCADVGFIKLNTIITSVFILIGCLITTSISYMFITVTVIRMPTKTGRQKTFSTCASHLTILSIFLGSAIFIEIRPPGEYSIEKDKMVHLVSTVLAPFLNPFVYTLRNQKVKNCIKDASKHITSLSC